MTGVLNFGLRPLAEVVALPRSLLSAPTVCRSATGSRVGRGPVAFAGPAPTVRCMPTTDRRPAPPLLGGAPLIEVPTTRDGWATAAWDLNTRIDAYVYWSLGGEAIPDPAAARMGRDGSSTAFVAGHLCCGFVPFRGSTYIVDAVSGRVLDSLDGQSPPDDIAERVLAAVLRARENVRELPEVCELISRGRAVVQFLKGTTSPSFWNPRPALHPVPAALLEQRARDALLWVAARSLTGLAQTVATTHARADFPGTCAELVEASTAAAAALAATPAATT